MGNLLASPITDKETHTGSTSEGVYFGVSSMQGWRVHMEDAHIAEKELYAECPHKSVDEGGFEKINVPDHALFACFDGHGGCFAAEYAGRNLCRVLSRQPKFIRYAKFAQEREKQEQLLKSSADRAHYVRAGMEMLEGALRDAFIDLDREIFRATRGEVEPGANAPYHGPALPEAAANKNETMDSIEGSNENPANDEKANKDPSPNEDEDSGTTAVVVMVTPHVVICANAGDSRAVLSKNGHKALPLSYDHKPDDEEEERRIRAAGGYVAGGRVEGDLAVSRGFGDFRFKNAATVLAGATGFNERKETEEKVTEQNSTIMKADEQKVSPVPDIIIQNRSEQDEFIVVACDGIWDVQTNYECVKTVTDIFQEGESDLGLVCEELLDMCLTMGSKDNMTALVIRFPAEKIGEGGGVKARRDKREATARANEAGNHHDSDHEHTEPEDSKMEETNEDSTAT